MNWDSLEVSLLLKLTKMCNINLNRGISCVTFENSGQKECQNKNMNSLKVPTSIFYYKF